jgi:hypothetical protein
MPVSDQAGTRGERQKTRHSGELPRRNGLSFFKLPEETNLQSKQGMSEKSHEESLSDPAHPGYCRLRDAGFIRLFQS